MIKGIKIRLYPTKEQEILLWKSAGTARFAYNWAKRFSDTYYRIFKKTVSCGAMRKHFTKVRKHKKYAWLNEVSSEIPQQAIKDFDNARTNFFEGRCEFPKLKTKKKTIPSFFHNNNKFVVDDGYIQIEKIGKIRMSDENRLPRGRYKKDKIKVTNPRIKHNGRYWYLSVGIEYEKTPLVLNPDLSIGIDLGIKELAIVSNFEKPFCNINKTKSVRKLKKRIKRLKRQVSRKYEKNRRGKQFIKTNNIRKLEHRIKILEQRLTNIRVNYAHQVTNTIAKTKPSRIVMETLNVSGMLKNRHLSDAIQEQGFYRFIQYMKYKSEKYGIKFIQADRFYPSSKTCSCCGHIKSDLKLSDRIYCCDNCGLIIDRDKNASINLANYQSA